MAHFAQLDSYNTVINVVAVNNDVVNNLQFPYSEPYGVDFLKSTYGQNTRWKQTSYSNKFRNTFASIGYRYRELLDAFIEPKPFPSWKLNEKTLKWEAPVESPGEEYVIWDEQSQQWTKE